MTSQEELLTKYYELVKNAAPQHCLPIDATLQERRKHYRECVLAVNEQTQMLVILEKLLDLSASGEDDLPLPINRSHIAHEAIKNELNKTRLTRQAEMLGLTAPEWLEMEAE